MTRLWTSLRVGEKEKNLNCSKYSPFHWHFGLFLMSLLLEKTTKKSG
jgi:hypothetical protein